jgi:DNA modification methylase
VVERVARARKTSNRAKGLVHRIGLPRLRARAVGEVMNRIEFGDCREIMRRWYADGVRVKMCVTSPPYFGLRDYGVQGQIGVETTVEEYVKAMVETFRAVRDILADDGTLWLNLGDSYNAAGRRGHGTRQGVKQGTNRASAVGADICRPSVAGLKEKDLIGIPWAVAFALRNDGWYLRQDIIWAKPNPMPESVQDRCTKSHEYIFLLSKSSHYYFNADAIRQPYADKTKTAWGSKFKGRGDGSGLVAAENLAATMETHKPHPKGANRRDVWTITPKSFKGAHFATFPPDLIEPCILAGSNPADIVLDPFMGSGTVAGVAIKHGRQYLGCELNLQYGDLHEARIKSIVGGKA